MTVIVTASAAFGLTVSDAKTEIMYLLTYYGGVLSAAGQLHKQTAEFVYLGGAIIARPDLSVKVTRRDQSMGVLRVIQGGNL